MKYEVIRGRLITMFRARRCVFAEDLADATIERVAQKVATFNLQFTGDPALYFYGVAKKVFLEYQRESTVGQYRQTIFAAPDTVDDELESRLTELDRALSTIPKSDRELILKYYEGNTDNIPHRRAIASELGIQLSTLRLRVFRIKREIKTEMCRNGQTDLSLSDSL